MNIFSRRRAIRQLAAGGLCCLLSGLAWSAPARAVERAEPADPHPRLMGTLSCSSASCHGRSAPLVRAGNLGRQEYLRWFDHDPHAHAAATLDSDRFQQILVRVSRRADGAADPAVYRQCAECHDPLGMAENVAVSTQRGIGCESCHGAAEHWLTWHYERDVSKSQLAGLGMVDTENLLVRGRMCAACHVGSGDRNMNHDMIAAGHPPLRFELSSYHDLLGRKHWDETRERLETPDFQVQLWAAGQLASAEAALTLLESRAANSKATWPELAEYNCFACHQRLRPSETLTLRGAAGALRSPPFRKPGIPAWNEWNLAHVDGLLGAAAEQEPALDSLRTLLGQSFSPDRRKVAAAASAACSLIRTKAGPQFAYSSDALLRLLARPASGEVSWEASCQRYVALVAAERAYRDELAKLHYSGLIPNGEYRQMLVEHQPLTDDFAAVRGWLQFESKPASGQGWLSDEPVQFYSHRDEVQKRLQAIAVTLQQAAAELRGRQ